MIYSFEISLYAKLLLVIFASRHDMDGSAVAHGQKSTLQQRLQGGDFDWLHQMVIETRLM